MELPLSKLSASAVAVSEHTSTPPTASLPHVRLRDEREVSRIASFSMRLPTGWKMYVSIVLPAPGRLPVVAVVENELAELLSSSSLSSSEALLQCESAEP